MTKERKRRKWSFYETIWIEIEFLNSEENSNFIKWTLDNKIYNNVKGGYAGLNKYGGHFTKKDAEKIYKYLKNK